MTTDFEILPAIDLRAGRVVRLEQGDFARETAFSDDPVAVARSFADAGARWLHVVDLDGARVGTPQHAATIAGVVDSVGSRLRVEVAGGLRTADDVRAALRAGSSRVVVGTAALDDPAFARHLITEHGPQRVAVAIDVRGGRVQGHGWQDAMDRSTAEDAIVRLADAGVVTFEVTAIERDGTGNGPDLDLYRRVIDLDRGAIVASAGIASTEDISAVRGLGCSGAIVGRALYDGRLEMRTALAAAIAQDPIEVRHDDDGELIGSVVPPGSGRIDWLALTVFGGILGHARSAAEARSLLETRGLAVLARRWFHRSRADGAWEVVVIQEAWPGRVRVVQGPYALPAAAVRTITADDLAAGDILTLEPPPEADLEQFRD